MRLLYYFIIYSIILLLSVPLGLGLGCRGLLSWSSLVFPIREERSVEKSR